MTMGDKAHSFTITSTITLLINKLSFKKISQTVFKLQSGHKYITEITKIVPVFKGP